MFNSESSARGYAEQPTLERYTNADHLVVSFTGDPAGFVDQALAECGASRRVALAVPNFMIALALIAESDLVSALPRSFVAMHGGRFGVMSTEPPLRLPRFPIRAVATKAAMMDAGVAWLFALLEKAASGCSSPAGFVNGESQTRRCLQSACRTL